MPANAENFPHYSDDLLLDLIALFKDNTRQAWVSACARAELRSRGCPMFGG